MSDEARYEVLELPGEGHRRNHAILKRKSNGTLETIMPNVGVADNAIFIVKQLVERDDRNRRASEEREREFQEGLKHPHRFLLANSRVELCYCGKPSKDPIHIEEDEGE